MQFIQGAELLIHKCPLSDVGFMDYEFAIILMSKPTIFVVTDTLQMARQMYPGKRNSLDALLRIVYILIIVSVHCTGVT